MSRGSRLSQSVEAIKAVCAAPLTVNACNGYDTDMVAG